MSSVILIMVNRSVKNGMVDGTMASEELDMRKFALALLVAVASSLPAFGETLPIVVRGGGAVVRVEVPIPPASTVVVCVKRPNSIGGLTVTRCRALGE
jgi:hypothetical protein